MEKLPAEVRSDVFHLVPRFQWPPCRLVCKKWRENLTPLIFNTVSLGTTEASLDRLSEIAQAESVCKYVKTLRLNGARLPDWNRQNFAARFVAAATEPGKLARIAVEPSEKRERQNLGAGFDAT